MRKRDRLRKARQETPMVDILVKEVLTYLPVFMSVLIMIMFGGVYKLKAIAWAFMVSGISGIIVVVRKESPRLVGGVYGKPAVFSGILWLVFMWGSGLYILLGVK